MHSYAWALHEATKKKARGNMRMHDGAPVAAPLKPPRQHAAPAC